MNAVRAFSRVRNFSQLRTLLNAESHVKFLSNYYSKDILESIKLAESVVEPEHYKGKKLPNIEFAPHYLDDYSSYDPFWDYSTTKQTDFEQAQQPIPRDIPEGYSLPTGSNSNPTQLLAKGLAKLTGLDPEYITKLTVRPLVLKTVTNQTAKGKIRSFYSLVVVGDKNGMVGIGEGKDSAEMSKSIRKAHWNAVKNLTHIPRFEDRTIYNDVEHKYGATLVKLRAAPSGSGLRVNHNIFEICECAGIKDLAGKVYRSRNSMNVAKCAIEALQRQVTLEELAAQRGKKIVDLRKIYYSS
ncbi:hypothetical protein LJB42_004370 [Komagataella kurtzmanii]|nr:hypothetical protein LJB42_004370 [Komagataella kurtzmanii]